jgi:hypothetical protein
VPASFNFLAGNSVLSCSWASLLTRFDDPFQAITRISQRTSLLFPTAFMRGQTPIGKGAGSSCQGSAPKCPLSRMEFSVFHDEHCGFEHG